MKHLEVCCAIIEETIENKTLVWAARKDKSSHLAGLWEFPGGKIESGETAGAALVREIKEELGVSIDILSPLSPSSHHYETHQITLHPFICRIKEQMMPKPLEHESIALLHIDSLPSLAWAGADIPILREYLLKSNSHEPIKNLL